MDLANHSDAAAVARARSRLDDDVHFVAECGQKRIRRSLEKLVSRPLSRDLACELRVGQLFLGFGEAQIHKNITASRSHSD